MISEEKTFRVVFFSNIRSIKHFYQQWLIDIMVRRSRDIWNRTDRFYLGHIVAIASNCGLFGISHLGDYCGSKFAVIGRNWKSFHNQDDIDLLFPGYMECVEDEIFRSKCSGVNTTSTCRQVFFSPSFRSISAVILVVIVGPLKGGLNRRVTEIVM